MMKNNYTESQRCKDWQSLISKNIKIWLVIMEKQTYKIIKITTDVTKQMLIKIESLTLSEKELETFWKNNQYIAAGCSNIVSEKECYCQSAFTNKEIISIIQIKI